MRRPHPWAFLLNSLILLRYQHHPYSVRPCVVVRLHFFLSTEICTLFAFIWRKKLVCWGTYAAVLLSQFFCPTFPSIRYRSAPVVVYFCYASGTTGLGLSFCFAVGCVAHSTLFNCLIITVALMLLQSSALPPSASSFGGSSWSIKKGDAENLHPLFWCSGVAPDIWGYLLKSYWFLLIW